MKSRNDRVLEWAVAKAAKDYSADVAILAVYGSYINGTSDELSDVDFFFIPKTDRGLLLGRTFIIEDVGFDLFPMSWDRVKGLSAFREPLQPLLGNSRVAYAASYEDENRFLSLRKAMEDNLQDASYMHERASEAFHKGLVYLSRLRNEHDAGVSRLLAGQMILCLSDAVAYENQTYFRSGLKSHFNDISRMKAIPEGYLGAYEGVITSSGYPGIRHHAEQMAQSCGDFLGLDDEAALRPEHLASSGKAASRTTQQVNYDELVSFYEEAVSSFNKVWRSCDEARPDYRGAFIAGICLQRVLNEEVPFLGLEVLSSFDHSDLGSFAAAVRMAEKAIVSCIEKVRPLIRYSSIEDFLSGSGSI